MCYIDYPFDSSSMSKTSDGGDFRKIMRDVGGEMAVLGGTIRSIIGYLFISAWWVYFRVFRISIAPHLPTALLVFSGADFLMVAVEKLNQMHLRMDENIADQHRSIPHLWIDKHMA